MSEDAIPSAHKVRKRSVRIAGHRTSVSLEDAFWRELTRIAEARGQSINALIAAIDAGRGGNLSSAVRVFILNEVRNANAM
jgi:predicted DNA-binding ribbon-helix-helix protein